MTSFLGFCHFGEKGAFGGAKDKDGAYLIDRSPDVFRVILEGLRTGLVYIPKDITMFVLSFLFSFLVPHAGISFSFADIPFACRDQLIVECEFYCLDSLLQQFKDKVEEDSKIVRRPAPTLPTSVRYDGAYVGDECIVFLDNGRFVMSKRPTGARAEKFNPLSVVMAFIHSFPIPAVWSDTCQKLNIDLPNVLAMHATNNVLRGHYEQNEDGKLILRVAHDKVLLGFLSHSESLIYFDPSYSPREHTPYITLNFQPFEKQKEK